MIKWIKGYIKTQPRWYDRLNVLRPSTREAEVWLHQFSKAHQRGVRFIQVGANDGLRCDPARKFIVRDGWSGVLIEPLQPVFKMLQRNYAHVRKGKLIFENCAIADSGGDHIDIWSYSEDFLNSLPLEKRLLYLRKSSLDKTHVERCIRELGAIEEKIKCYSIRCTTLRAIIERHFPDSQVDLILIDAEGRDDSVIRTLNFDVCKPSAIFYESHNLGDRQYELETFLSKQGYQITQLEGDSVAIRLPGVKT